MDHHAKFEKDRTILTWLNHRKELTVSDGRTEGQTYGPTLIIEKLRF